MDSSVFRYVGKVILSGGMPYRDTFDHKGPLLYLIQAAGMSLGSYGLWALEFLAMVITSLYLYKIARMFAGRKVSCVSVICSSLILAEEFYGNMPEEYALPFLTVSLYIFLDYFNRSNITKWRLAVCGASCAAVALIRVNMCGLWVVMCVGVLIECIPKNRIREIAYDVFWFSLGFCVLAVPILLWLYVNQVFEDFIQEYFLFNFLYSSPSTERASLENQLGAIYYFLLITPMLFSFAVLLYRYMEKKKFVDLLLFFSYMFNLYLMCISGQSYRHYGILLFPLVSYALTVFLSAFQTPEMKSAILVTVTLVSLTFSLDGILMNVTSNGTRGLGYTGRTQIKIAQAVREHSEDSDRITVCGNLDSVYLLSDRWSVSKYSYQVPICFIGSEKSLKMQEEYFRDVETLKPKLIVLSFADFPAYDRMKELAEQSYELVDVIDYYEIYVRR